MCYDPEVKIWDSEIRYPSFYFQFHYFSVALSKYLAQNSILSLAKLYFILNFIVIIKYYMYTE